MKKLKTLIILFVFTTFLGSAQNSYIEWNIGVANIDEGYGGDFWAPGTSVLIGKRFNLSENLILDAEIGLAVPSILTAKIGLGTYFNKETKSAVVFGVRPWPLHGYVQMNLPQGEKGQWIISGEISDASVISLYSNYMLTIGYCWKLNLRKKENK